MLRGSNCTCSGPIFNHDHEGERQQHWESNFRNFFFIFLIFYFFYEFRITDVNHRWILDASPKCAVSLFSFILLFISWFVTFLHVIRFEFEDSIHSIKWQGLDCRRWNASRFVYRFIRRIIAWNFLKILPWKKRSISWC